MSKLRHAVFQLQTKDTQVIGGVTLENDVRRGQEDGRARKVTWNGTSYQLWWACDEGFSTNSHTSDLDRAVGWLEGGA